MVVVNDQKNMFYCDWVSTCEETLFLFYIKTQKSHLFLRLIHSCHQSINLPASDATFQLYKKSCQSIKIRL